MLKKIVYNKVCIDLEKIWNHFVIIESYNEASILYNIIFNYYVMFTEYLKFRYQRSVDKLKYNFFARFASLISFLKSQVLQEINIYFFCLDSKKKPS